MKKIICLLMAICLMATIGLTAAHAENGYYIMGDSSGSSTITYTEQSRYTVYIPETINMDMGYYTFEASEMNITDREDVVVTMTNLDVNSMLHFTHENGSATADKQIGYDYANVDDNVQNTLPEHCVAYFKNGETTSEASFYLINDNNMNYQAGNYSGMAQFLVELRAH